MHVLSVRTSTSMGVEKLSDTELLTPEDKIIKERLANKYRRNRSKKEQLRRKKELKKK